MKHHIATGLKAGLIALSLTGLAACGGGGMSTTDLAPSATSGTVRKVPAMSLDVHKRIQKAHEAIDRKDYAAAKALLTETLGLARVNDYERAVAWQLRAMIAYEEDSVADTIAAYEQILEFSQSIPEALELVILYGLAQLHYSEDQYDEALTRHKEWEARVDPSLINTDHMIFGANLQYVRGDYQAAIGYVSRAISMAEAAPALKPRQPWYQLALSAHWEMEDLEGVRDTLDTLLQRWPHAAYCVQRAAIEAMITGNDDGSAVEQVRQQYTPCQDVDFTSKQAFPKIQATKLPTPGRLPGNAATPYDDYLPIVRVQPQYPRKAVEEKVSGYVLIELTVNPDGTVPMDSILVLESEPKGYFEEAATSAASKFKYKPIVINGKPQKVLGVKYRFSFEIAN